MRPPWAAVSWLSAPGRASLWSPWWLSPRWERINEHDAWPGGDGALALQGDGDPCRPDQWSLLDPPCGSCGRSKELGEGFKKMASAFEESSAEKAISNETHIES